MQYNLYTHIKKSSPTLLKVSSLKNICSNPVSICQSLEKKRLIILVKKGKEYSIDDLSFKPVEKKISFNSDQKIVINKLNKSLETRKFNSHLLHCYGYLDCQAI